MTNTGVHELQDHRELGEPTVLLIDDDANTLLVLTAVLDARGLRILDAEGDKGALQWCRTINREIDVFVVDVILRGSNGPDLVRLLKRVQPAARVLFISGFELTELSRRGILSRHDLIPGSTEFLQKPFEPEVFISAVERLIACGSGSIDH